ncbi:D-alanyl-D-alanine carboxypeptidase family protein [Roseicella aquatilis]|nr:D-alanyl-D-alanine carboxypeptidase family protein [Roseicella aquatilis]
MLALGVASATPAAAQIGSERYSALVVEARSGNALVAANPDERRYPASLTKMMTAYMAFEALREGKVELSSPVPVSYSAASMSPSKLGLAPGTTLTVEDCILAMATKSANDAAAALGEFLGGGSEDRFAQMMTLRARSLGMRNTTFRNASGLPDAEQTTTARDMTILGQRLIRDFPQYYGYFSTPYFVFRGRTLFNHNRLLQQYDGADGIKTGYVDDSGFNLVASAQREGVRLVAAVFGGRTGGERDRHMMALLDQGFTGMGIAPRSPVMASRGLGGMVASAHAATLAQSRREHLAARTERARAAREARLIAARADRAAVRVVRAAPKPVRAEPRLAQKNEPRTGLLRMAAARNTRQPVRMEQGDTSRSTAAAPRAAAVKAKPVKAAEKPAVKAGAGPRRAS